MQTIRIESEYQGWVEDKVIQVFESAGVKVTGPARTMLAYLLQAQREEALVPGDAQLFQMADYLLARALGTYEEMYGAKRMTINRAIHLAVELNIRFKVFPWGTTD